MRTLRSACGGALCLALVGKAPTSASPPAPDAAGAAYDIAGYLEQSPDVARFIAHRIWQNEAAGQVRLLTSWNDGEGHASLGIGHFIWYPAGVDGPYRESFIDLLRFFERRGVEAPAWLASDADCPWPDRAAFERALDAPLMVELRRFLVRTIDQQLAFLVDRLERALPAIASAAAPAAAARVRAAYDRVLRAPDGRLSPGGVYALLDYTNFKGEGVDRRERYRGEGWGLLQVLQHMPAGETDPRDAFADAAGVVLTRRVANAPRDETGFLDGWLRRLGTYRTTAFAAAFAAFDGDG